MVVASSRNDEATMTTAPDKRSAAEVLLETLTSRGAGVVRKEKRQALLTVACRY
jgi:hypothetical protein